MMSLRFLSTRASGFVPVLMSIAALLLVGAALALGAQGSSNGDEGGAARLWQLLMAGQLPVIAYFVVRWLPTARREGTIVLAAQAAAFLVALAPVFLLGL